MQRGERLVFALIAVFVLSGGLGRFVSPLRWLLGVAGTALVAASVLVVENNRARHE